MNFENQKSLRVVKGVISHQRLIKPNHSFSYKCLSILLDITNLEIANKTHRFFSVDKFNIISWYNKDHGVGDINLIDWVQKTLAEHKCNADGKIILHCFPRILGRSFNPLSIYFCYDKSNNLSATIYEVRNTFGGIHSYVSPENSSKFHKAKKEFLVSPFLPSEGFYNLHASILNNSVKIIVGLTKNNKAILNAKQIGGIYDLTTSSLLYGIVNSYTLPGKPFIGILFEALKLWYKGAKFKYINSSKEHKTTSAK